MCIRDSRADGGDVEHAGGGDDEEDGEDVRDAPDDLVVHAGDDVAVVLEMQEGAEGRQHEPVSYTHLTLPTSDLVEISVVAE